MSNLDSNQKPQTTKLFVSNEYLVEKLKIAELFFKN